MMELALSTTYFSDANNTGGIFTFSLRMKSHHSLVQFDNTWNRLEGKLVVEQLNAVVEQLNAVVMASIR